MNEIKVGDCFKNEMPEHGVTEYFRVTKVQQGRDVYSIQLTVPVFDDEIPCAAEAGFPLGVPIPRSELDAAAKDAIKKIQEALEI